MSVGLKANVDGTSGTVQVNGNDVVTVNSAGNVGIGTTAPSCALDVVRSAANSVVNITSGSNTLQLFENTAGDASLINYASGKSITVSQAGAGFINFGTNNTERMRIDSSGNVGIGLADPSQKLDVAGGISLRPGGSVGANAVLTADASSGANGISLIAGFASGGYGPIKFVTSATERMRIDIAGNVGIGTGSPSYQLQLSTNSAAKPASNVWTVASDERVKTVTGEYTKGLDAVCSLRPVTYKYNGKAGFVADGAENISIIAQEARGAFPECIGTFSAKLNETDEEETELLNWDGHALTFALVNAIKELRAQNEDLRARVAALEAK